MTNNSHQDEKVRRGLAWPNRARRGSAAPYAGRQMWGKVKQESWRGVVRDSEAHPRALSTQIRNQWTFSQVEVEGKSHISPWAS